MDAFAVLREGNGALPGGDVSVPGALVRMWHGAAVRVGGEPQEYVVVPGLLRTDGGCTVDGAEPAVCLGFFGPNASLQCATVEQVRRQGLLLKRKAGQGEEIVVLVADGVGHVRMTHGSSRSEFRVRDNIGGAWWQGGGLEGASVSELQP